MNKKLSILILLLIGLILVACAKQSEKQIAVETDNEKTGEEPSTEKEEITTEKPSKPTSPTGIMVDYWSKAEKVKNYKFLRAKLPLSKADDRYYVKDNKIKIELMMPQTVPEGRFNTVYLNTETKKAVGRCLDVIMCKKENLNKPYPASYDTYIMKLPHEYLQEIYAAEKVGSKQFDQKSVDVIRYEKDGNYYEAYLYSYYGMPLRVAWYSDPERTKMISGWEFRDFAVNSVTDEDVTPPIIKME